MASGALKRSIARTELRGSAPQMEDLLSRIALAFGIGLLIGLERGWNTRQLTPGSRAAGVRTFAITGLLGGLVGAMAKPTDGAISVAGALLIGIAFAAYAAVIAVFTREENRAGGKFSATTAIAALLTFVLGVYALLGNVHVAASSAVAAAGVLVLREGIHGWIAKITRRELESGLVLLAMSFIALPILPDRSVGPFGGVNVREVWIIAIALASTSFAAYVAVKYYGERKGVLISAAIGGLISSTAVAFTNARRAASGEGSARILAGAISLATAVSFLRVTVIVAVLAPSVALPIGLPLVVAALVATALALMAIYDRPAAAGTDTSVPFRNPFGFWSVLAIAASMGVLIVVGRYVNERFGAAGTIAGAASMGLFDVDAMTVSMTSLVPAYLSPRGATYAILAGVASNTLTKIAIAGVIGRGRFAAEVARMAIGCLVAGGVVLWVVSRIWL
jgi:uncharacterized membrane protein (DUF4010 family)